MESKTISWDKLWTDDKADSVFSKLVRLIHPKCQRCKWASSTDCSHFYERHHSATRYEFDNADGLCRECHQLWEGRKNGYIEYKKEQLGIERFNELEKKYRSTMVRTDAIKKFQESIINQK